MGVQRSPRHRQGVSFLEGDAHWYGAAPMALERGRFTFSVHAGSVAGLRFDFTVVERPAKKSAIAWGGNVYGP